MDVTKLSQLVPHERIYERGLESYGVEKVTGPSPERLLVRKTDVTCKQVLSQILRNPHVTEPVAHMLDTGLAKISQHLCARGHRVWVMDTPCRELFCDARHPHRQLTSPPNILHGAGLSPAK